MTNIRAFETRYNGVLYRSRTEARWAFFFDAINIGFDYEPEAYRTGVRGYLPDFRLWPRHPGMRWLLEVKGQYPTDDEIGKAVDLTRVLNCDLLLVIGAPDEKFQLIWFDRGVQRPGLYVLAQDRCIETGFWLLGDERTEEVERWIGPLELQVPRHGPMFSGALEQAYQLARAQRFEDNEFANHRVPAIPHPVERTAAWLDAA